VAVGGALVAGVPGEIQAEAGIITENVAVSADRTHRDVREIAIATMKRALVSIGDAYRAPDGVLYSLVDAASLDRRLATIRSIP
jgi:hypothetical protein